MSRSKVQSIHPQVSAGALRIIDRIERAADMKAILDRDYLIKGWLDRGALSVLYGDANVGKSFWAIDVAHHVQEGLEWAGRRVRQGQVLYIAAEGGAMLNNRLAAREARFMVLRDQLTLAGRNHAGPALAEAVERLASQHGRFSLIVIDTMARVMGSADENAATDISSLMSSLDMIRARTGAHVMLVHHTGKDASRGARGHSSLRGAIDTEIELSEGDRESPYLLARNTKQRDQPRAADIEFDLRTVTLGQDSDGDYVTSCVVRHHPSKRS